MEIDLRLGDCLEVLRTLPENSIDSLCTDPPYGIRFMGKAWDGADIVAMTEARMRHQQTLGKNGKPRPSPRCAPSESAGKYSRTHEDMKAFQEWTELWAREVFRVLKPGAHALVFCSPRSYHRMASGLEDAGFEIRDQIQWLFGSGFPKSLDVSKAINKSEAQDIVDVEYPGCKIETINGLVNEKAKQWQGWGTALKPANEPICLARKPLSENAVAKNVLKWGTGGLNIDGCRIGTEKIENGRAGRATKAGGIMKAGMKPIGFEPKTGRFPANLILSHSPNCTEEGCDMFDCPVKGLDEQSGNLKNGGQNYKTKGKSIFGTEKNLSITNYAGDSGGASRFFYCAKVSSRERNQGCDGLPKHDTYSEAATTPMRDNREQVKRANNHPTVKPIKIMSYLCRLVTPPAGVILDPFMGSGSTGMAALQEGFKFIGIEREKEYFEIAEKRIESVQPNSE